MGFASPFWLLLALAGLVVFYLHVRRRPTVTVPSLFLWAQVASGKPTRRPMHMPRWTLPLVLQLLVIAALTLALAGPYLGRSEGTHRILVIDAGARTEAVAAAQRLIDGAPPDAHNPVSIVAAGPSPRIVAAWIDDRAALDAALGWIEPLDGGIDRQRTDALLESLERDGEAANVAWIEGEPRPQLAAQATREGSDWLITGALTVPKGGDRPTALKALFMPEGAPGFLDWADVPLTFEENTARFSTQFALPGAGALSLQAPGGEASARLMLHADASRRVLYLGEPTPAVVRAFQAVPGTSLFQADRLPENDREFDLVVIDGTSVPRRPETNTLYLGSGHVAGEVAPERIEADAATFWQPSHPLSREVDWTGLGTIAGFSAPMPDGGQELLGVAGKPLVWARSTRDGREVRIGLDLRTTPWVDEPGYVALMGNVLDWSGLGAAPPACVTGAACPVPARLLSGAIGMVAETVLAEGEQATRALLPQNAFTGEDGWLAPGLEPAFVPGRAGLYRVSTADGRAALIAVNAAPTELGAADTAEGGVAPVSAGLAIWWLLLGLALVAMAGEFALSMRAERLALRRSHPRWLQNRVTVGTFMLGLLFLLAAMAGVPMPQPVAGRQVIIAATPERSMEIDGHATAIGMGHGERPGGAAGDALMLAAASVPAGRDGRIFLEWDGNLTEGMLAPALRTLAERGVAVDGALPPARQGVSVEGVFGPSRVFAGDIFVLDAMVESWVARGETIEIVRDGTVIATQQAQLSNGSNRIEAAVEAQAEGTHFYEVRVAGLDTPTAKAGIWIATSAGPRVALLAGQDAAASSFAEALGLQGLAVTTLASGRAPASLAGWLDYDAVVMMDVPATALAPRQQEQLETAVRDHGRGLLLLGGPNSFGPGGYFETRLEALSPLSSRVPRNAPKTGFVFVLDRSGSMQRDEGGMDRLSIAKAAVLNATGLLNPQSQVGIVAFDSSAHTVLPLQDAGADAAIRGALSQLDADGGTAVYPALSDAVTMLRGLDLPKRHIVVISDGLTQPGDFEGLLGEARADGITVSAIAIGDAADPTSLSNIAALGGGAFHWSRDFRALPGILAQEALLSETSPVKERTVTPQWLNRNDAFLKAAPDNVPPLDGYVDTTAKPRAHLHLATSDEEGNVVPIMASWRYGAGQVLSLATQATGRWSAGWNALPDYPRFWAQIVRGLVPPPQTEVKLDVVREGDQALARVASTDLPRVAVSGPSAGTMRMIETAPARWEGRWTLPEDGDYEITARIGELAGSQSLHVPYPAALSQTGTDAVTLESLVRITGGAMAGEGSAPRPQSRWAWASGWQAWTVLAAALFLASLVLRYLPGLVTGRRQTVSAPVFERAA
ncbi:hypothetical protein XM25_21905 [Devosia sp. H5989]|nr:hypothetical protein XM25_21905 [Devosia sp. H5989]